MKRIFTILLLLVTLPLAVIAGREQDFSSRFISLYGAEHELSCKTISPKMMEKIMQLDSVEANAQALQILAQLKSIRILTCNNEGDESQQLFEKAITLAKRNKRRYKSYTQTDDMTIYTRRHGKRLVELVVVQLKEKQMFQLLNFTGNMSDEFIHQVLAI